MRANALVFSASQELAAKEMMECPFSPILVAKRPVGEIASDDYATMDGKAQPVHDRLYNARGRTQVCVPWFAVTPCVRYLNAGKGVNRRGRFPLQMLG